MTVLLGLLILMCASACMVVLWIHLGALRDARESGHPYWMMNPLAILVGFRAMNLRVYLPALGVLVGSLLLILVLLGRM